MELERYGRVFRRRWWLIAGIVVLTALVSAIYPVVHPSGWKATTMVLVSPISGASSAQQVYYYDPAYYQELTSEYVLDDFSELISKGNTFSQQVIAQLKQSPQPDVRAAAQGMDANALSKQFTVKRVHRLLTVDVSAPTRDLALAQAQAADQLIATDGRDYFAQLGQPSGAASAAPDVVTVSVAAQPHITAQPGLAKDALFWLLRTLVGLAAALAIVLVLHYFDDRLYDERDVQGLLDLPVLGSVTAPAGQPTALPRRPAVAKPLAPAGAH